MTRCRGLTPLSNTRSDTVLSSILASPGILQSPLVAQLRRHKLIRLRTTHPASMCILDATPASSSSEEMMSSESGTRLFRSNAEGWRRYINDMYDNPVVNQIDSAFEDFTVASTTSDMNGLKTTNLHNSQVFVILLVQLTDIYNAV